MAPRRVSTNAFTATLNGRELFRHRDDTFSEAGAFGLWSKPSNVTYFDDLKAEIADWINLPLIGLN